MPPTTTNSDLTYEKKLGLALQSIEASENPNIRQIARLYDILRATLGHRLRGRPSRHDAQQSNRKLTPTEEQTLLQRIISLDERGLSPSLPLVRRMADVLLQKHVSDASIGQL
jgi:hypothetical protein